MAGMGLINWIFDFYQQHRIEKLSEAAAVSRGNDYVDPHRLERALGDLALSVKTLQRLVVEKGICTESEYREMIIRIDGEDGRTDGRAPLQ